MADGDRPSSSRREAARRRQRGSQSGGRPKKLYAALDLGTNNCRLLIATPASNGFKVVDGFSRIVRLGAGLDQAGYLSETAINRALDALKVCAHKLGKTKVKRVRAVATQACRQAKNGSDFVDRVRAETGISLKIISTEEEARLALRGCQDLIDHSCDAALVLDIGGGSTEISWVRMIDGASRNPEQKNGSRLQAWVSLDLGVVSLAERFPEHEDRHLWFADMKEHARQKVAAFTGAHGFLDAFSGGNTHYIGTSGAVTSLAGVHLNLSRYVRSKVDGIWLSAQEIGNASNRLLAQTAAERAKEPCIGAERADLVMAGCAILQAVQQEWPSSRIRVADRGLREGLLLSMMASDRKRRGPRGRRR